MSEGAWTGYQGTELWKITFMMKLQVMHVLMVLSKFNLKNEMRKYCFEKNHK
jgi:hypothetical protein